LNLELQVIAYGDTQSFCDSPFDRNRNRLAVGCGLSLPLSSDNFFAIGQLAAVGRTIFAAQRPGWNLSFGTELLNTALFNPRETHRDDRYLFAKRQSVRADQLGDALALVALHIEEHEIGLAGAGAPGDLSHQHVLDAVERHEQKSSETNRQHHRGGLVVWAM
jgi:hypothetical protein